MNEKALRKQYSYLSRRARVRISKLEERNPSYKAVQRYKGEFPTLKELKSIGADSTNNLKQSVKLLEKVLGSNELSLVNSKRAVSGFIRTMNERGYDFINEDNAEEMLDFLDDSRARGLASYYGYEAVTEAVNRAQRKGLSKEQILGNIDYWVENAERTGRGETQKRLYVSKKRSSNRDFMK